MLPNLQHGLSLNPSVNYYWNYPKLHYKKKLPDIGDDHKIILENSTSIKYTACAIYFDPTMTGVWNKCSSLEF